MYNSQEIADRIKLTAKTQQKKISEILLSCNLGKNTVAKIAKGTDILTLNFAKIADCLNCSVDYLLGRTDNPTFGTNDLVYGKENNSTLTTEEQEFINKFNLLTDIDKGRILDRMETMHNAYAAGKSKAIFIAARNGNDEKTISERREKGIVNPEILDNIPTMKEE